ncbi:MAG: hypothetical protein STSR0007_09260 [Thermovirga sp.]
MTRYSKIRFENMTRSRQEKTRLFTAFLTGYALNAATSLDEKVP